MVLTRRTAVHKFMEPFCLQCGRIITALSLFWLNNGQFALKALSRLVRGWKYKQLVVKAAMAASLAPPTGKHQPSQGWTSAGASVKTVLFWFSTSTPFSMKKQNNDNESEIKKHDFPWFGNFDCPKLFWGWHKLGTECRFFWTVPGLAIFGTLWQSLTICISKKVQSKTSC